MTDFRQSISFVKTFEKISKVKSLHNEILIVHLLHDRGPLPSLQIMQETGRSISGHNADMKRLLSLGMIASVESKGDKRQRIFGLSDKALRLIAALDEGTSSSLLAAPHDKPDQGPEPVAARAG